MTDSDKKLAKKNQNWFYRKPQTKATWIMVFISCVMMWTLVQNRHVIQENANALQNAAQSLELQKIATSNAMHQIQIEEETRLNPELECAYDPYKQSFVIRN